jgi:PKD repeat protein
MMKEAMSKLSGILKITITGIALFLFGLDASSQSVTAYFTYNPDCLDFEFINGSSASGGANITDYLWDFDDLGSGVNNSSTLENPAHTFSGYGEYTITLTVSDADLGAIDTYDTIVRIYMPEAGFTFALTGNCGEVQFTNESQVTNGALSYLWWFDDNTTSTEENPLHIFTEAGDKEFTLTVTHESGCQAFGEGVVSFYEPIALFTHDPACVGVQTCFYDGSQPGTGTIVSWNWNFGDGSSSSLKNPCYIYANPGEYFVTLTVENSIGCIAVSEIDTLFVNYPPIANFNSSQTCFNDMTFFENLTDTNNIEILSWEWFFDDPASGANNISALYEPTHLFTAEGTFQVTLSVENVNGCTSLKLKTVVVDSIPEAAFTIPDTIALGNQITIIDNSIAHGTPILTRLWNFGDGVTIVNPNPITHTYTNPGSYDICLIVTNLKGCTDTICHTIVITALPHADFSYSIGSGLSTQFTDLSFTESLVVGWFWDFGDLSVTNDTLSGVQNPIYTYPSEGFYDVYLRVNDNYGGMRDTLKEIYVGPAVIADFWNIDVCSGEDVQLFDSSYTLISADFISWYWDFGDNTDTLYYQKADSFYHHYEVPGVYDVTFVTTGSINGVISTDTIVKQVTVFNPPVAKIDSLNLVACLGQPVHFVDSSYSIDGDLINSWFWDFGDGGSSTLQNPSYIYDSIRDYQVILTINTAHFCQDVDTIMAKVTIAPNVDFAIENACVNSPAYFIHTDSDIEITDWFWNFNDQYHPGIDTSTAENPSYVYTHIDVYHVTMEASSYGCTKKVDKSFIVYPIPYSEFTLTSNYTGVQGRTLFDNSSIYATSYLWDFGNGHTSNVENPIEVYEFDSTYTITLISFNEYGCSDTSRHDLSIFFKGLYFPTAFSPNNPNDEVSRFVPKGINLQEYLVQVFDLKGNLMWESDLLDENGSPVESWDGYCNGLLMPEGMYVWKATGIFRDGTEWKGSDLQYNNPQTNGTITLIK